MSIYSIKWRNRANRSRKEQNNDYDSLGKRIFEHVVTQWINMIHISYSIMIINRLDCKVEEIDLLKINYYE